MAGAHSSQERWMKKVKRACPLENLFQVPIPCRSKLLRKPAQVNYTTSLRGWKSKSTNQQAKWAADTVVRRKLPSSTKPPCQLTVASYTYSLVRSGNVVCVSLLSNELLATSCCCSWSPCRVDYLSDINVVDVDGLTFAACAERCSPSCAGIDRSDYDLSQLLQPEHN